MRNLIKQKKGELTDMLIFLVTIFILGIGLFIIIFIIPQITHGLKTAGLNNSKAGSDAIGSLEGMGSGTINYGFLMLFVGLIISVIITSFMIRSHPIFLFLYILFLAITILLAFYLGNAYQQMVTNPAFANVINDGSFINLVMSHIAGIVLAVGAISMIIIFSKFSTFGGTQQF